MDMQVAAVVQNAKDARPTLPVSTDSLWDKAAAQRERIARLIDAELKNLNVIGWIRKSKPGEYPLYVAVDSWMPISETQISTTFDRTFLKFEILVDPYREHPLIYKAEAKRHGYEYSGQHHELVETEVAELARYLVKGGSKPTFFRPRVPLVLRIIGAFIPFVGNAPKNKLIKEARPTHFTAASVLGWTGAIAVLVFGLTLWVVADAPGDESNFSGFGLFLGFCALGAAWLITTRREKCVAVPKQSLRTPRREFRVDSWHVSVPGAGEQFQAFRDRLYKAVMTRDPSISAELELHQDFTPRGVEERERLVFTRGQATLHIHIYPFSGHAFVGWESYLNWYRWAEGDAVSTTVRDGRKVTYHSLQVGVHVPTDFDLIEADVLAETTHRVLVDEIKGFMKEREIEADLDFKIIRGDRARALQEGKEEKQNTTASGGGLYRRRYE